MASIETYSTGRFWNFDRNNWAVKEGNTYTGEIDNEFEGSKCWIVVVGDESQKPIGDNYWEKFIIFYDFYAK